MLLRPTSMKIGLDNRVKLIISFKVSQIGLESSESSNSSGMTLEAFRSIAGKLRCDATMEPLGIDDNLLQINQLYSTSKRNIFHLTEIVLGALVNN